MEAWLFYVRKQSVVMDRAAASARAESAPVISGRPKERMNGWEDKKQESG
jgi:hypothetical protein